MESSSGGNNKHKIMTFRPTWEEFKDFNKYIEHIETLGAHKAGICKIIPPKEWVPRKEGYANIDITIPAPIRQVVHGKQGLYTQFNVQKKKMTVPEFRELANSDTYKTPRHTDYDDLERKYWKNISFVNPIYGADVSGSITDSDQHSWNIQKLGSILDCLGDDYGISIEGVNTAYLYFGMWKTTFAWHTEDMDLYSINYVHFGAPKRWYAIPPEHGRRLERLAGGFFAEVLEQCPAFLRHKMTVISPTILKRYSIPVDTVVQEAGEIIITFPFGYHSGFNHGFNCAESTNFASRRWIEYGKRCTKCHCRKDSVKIDMGAFVKRFQPKLYELWRDGKDIGPHPEDDRSRLYNHHHQDLINSTSPSKRLQHAQRASNASVSSSPVILQQGCETVKRTADSLTEAMAPHTLHDTEPGGSPAKKIKTEIADVTKVRKEPSSEYEDKQSILSRNGVTSNSGSLFPDNCSEMDAPTDLSDALTDVESDVEVKHDVEVPHDVDVPLSSKVTTKLHVKEAQTHTGSCKPKKKKSAENPSLLAVEGHWAKHLTKLWKFNEFDFVAEKKYNKKMSRRAPFCAVCSILNQSPESLRPLKGRTPMRSVPSLPQTCFLPKESEESQSVEPVKQSSKPRALLVCVECKVCVHDTCYGVKYLPDGPKNWRCSRCTSEDNAISCSLCCLRGGALKPTTEDGQWAHIVCAIANNEVEFKCVNQREPIVLSNMDKARSSLKCVYCRAHSFVNGKDRYGMCVQCTKGQCTRAFHMTCARAAGVKIDHGRWPFRLHLTCSHARHAANQSQTEEKNRPELSEGDQVYAKHKNGRFYEVSVSRIRTQLYYCVLFSCDNSTSQDLYPHDITNYPVEDGEPPLGSLVEVLWKDRLKYTGHFQGTRHATLYTVDFEDMSKMHIERDQIYSIHEQLPVQVRKRLSHASEMKNDVFYRKDRELLTEKRTRGVQVNYNYKWDIVPQGWT